MVTRERLETAQRFAALGCRIARVPWDDTGARDKGWKDLATADPAILEKWWNEKPSNFTMLTDGPLCCVDADRHVADQDGVAELERLAALHGGLPATHTDRTGRDGRHFVFKIPAGLTVESVKPLPGTAAVELLAAGGSMMLPGSHFVNGRQWTTIEHAFEFAELPAWLLELSKNGKGDGYRPHSMLHLVNPVSAWREWVDEVFPGAKWSGDEAMVKCPYHDDQTPSCSLNVKKRTFLCHASGCGEKGTLRRFAQQAAGAGLADPAELKELLALTKKPKQAEVLVKLCEDMELFHDADGATYATMEVATHRETWPVSARAQTFRDILCRRYYMETQEVPNSESLDAALGVLRGKALYDGGQLAVYVRLAGNDEHIYLDLGDGGWRCVEVTAEGWKVIDTPRAVRFRRPRGLLALPEPVHGGSLMDLAPFLNCASNADLMLMLAWLVAAMRPASAYCVLALSGEQGSGKSTVARRLRDLIDPNQATLRAQPREEDDLMIAANNGWLINLDNLSHFSRWMPDAICRLATGAGWAKRQLFADAEETIFNLMRPVVTNAISDLYSRGDLLDRSITVTLPIIPDDMRKQEKAMGAAFQAARPAILGGLLDVVVQAMKALPTTIVKDPPRMADFASWVAAAAPAIGVTAEEFLETYRVNRQAADQIVIEGSMVAQATMSFLDQEVTGTWRGSAKDLLPLLTLQVTEASAKDKAWPKTVEKVSRDLRHAAPALRKRGYDVRFEPREMNIRPIRLTKRGGA